MTDLNRCNFLYVLRYFFVFLLMCFNPASNAVNSKIDDNEVNVYELKSGEPNLVDPQLTRPLITDHKPTDLQKIDSVPIEVMSTDVQIEGSASDVLITEDLDDDVIQVDDVNEEILSNVNDKATITIVENIKLPNGSVYSGEVKFDVIREGFGTNEWPNGDRYKGEWLNDNPHGKGYKWHKNKDEYHGFFAFGQYSGLGDLKTVSGERYLGKFRFNQLDGLGIFISTNKEYYLGEFSQHKRHGRFLYYSQLSAKPKYQLWFNDALEKTIDANNIDDIENTHERQLINQMLQKFSLIAKKRLQQRRSNTHYQIRGRVRKIVSYVDDSPEHAFGDLIINLLDINE